MRPLNNNSLVKKCEVETQRLFQLFLTVGEDSHKFQSSETDEVQYFVRERPSSVRSSGSFGSASNISSRGLDDASKFQNAFDHRKQSDGISIPNRSGSSPMINSIAYSPNLVSDSARTPPNSFNASFTSCTPPSSSPSLKHAIERKRPSSSDFSRHKRAVAEGPSAASATFIPFPSEQQRPRSNTGPSEEVLAQTARTIADIGDDIEQEYGNKMTKLTTDLVGFLSENTSMSYEVFAAHVNELVGEDRNWTNLVFVMHLGKRVVRTTSYAGEYFGRFLGSAFGEEIARAGSTDRYVREHSKKKSSAGEEEGSAV